MMLNILLWFKWLAFLPLHLTVGLVRYPLAPIAVLFRDGYELPRIFWWLGTLDNDLTGDGGWKGEHCAGQDPASYCCMVRWLWRNGGHTFNYRILGCRVENLHPLFRRFYWIAPINRYFEVFLGWNTQGPQDGWCKYVFTFRFKRNK